MALVSSRILKYVVTHLPLLSTLSAADSRLPVELWIEIANWLDNIDVIALARNFEDARIVPGFTLLAHEHPRG